MNSGDQVLYARLVGAVKLSYGNVLQVQLSKLSVNSSKIKIMLVKSKKKI